MRIRIETVGGESVVILPPSMLERIGNPDEVNVVLDKPGRIVVTSVKHAESARLEVQVAEDMEDAVASDSAGDDSASRAAATSRVIRTEADINNFARDPRLPSIDEIQNRGRDFVVDQAVVLELIIRATPTKMPIPGRRMSYEEATEATFHQYDETFKKLAEDD
ncbi:MAG: hypothetical protein P4L33_07505 [Capsulimonadaceae bacterium]|nr:hypothetical protein [Capsulimonadaceae bacterium]